MFYNEHISKETKTSFKILSTFLILIITSILISNINIEKTFAVEKESILPLKQSNSNIKNQVDRFADCITNTIKNGDSSHLPKFFKDEPTKTDMAICFKQTTNKQI